MIITVLSKKSNNPEPSFDLYLNYSDVKGILLNICSRYLEAKTHLSIKELFIKQAGIRI